MPVRHAPATGFALLLMSGWIIAGWLTSLRAAAPAEPAPGFALKLRGAAEEISLTNLAGKIVVLDFFAHWCVPCVRCSAEIEGGIHKYYFQGNIHHVPVEVLAVNIEPARPERTDAFIKRAGLARVLDDPTGEVFRKYGGEAMPFVVIIDATGLAMGKPACIAYREAGFHGVGPLRHVIDAINVPSLASSVPPPLSSRMNASVPAPAAASNARAAAPLLGAEPPAPATMSTSPLALQPQPVPMSNGEESVQPGSSASASMPTAWLADVDFACLWASDILLTDETIELRQTRPDYQASLKLTHGHIGLDYVPESRLEHPAEVDNEHFGFQLHGEAQASRRLRLLGGGGAYYGYMDYRTLWLNEHFEQLYSRRPGYQTAHPWGYNASGGCRWEYVPAAAFVQGDLAWQQDVIAPGYEVVLTLPPRLVRFRDTYDTLSGRATFENVLTPWLRAQQIVQVTDTTDRQLRFSLESDANVALGEPWVLRLSLAGAKEEPQFESWSLGATLEHDWNDTWFVSLSCRYYQDTGQIENALLAENTAGPPLKALLAGVGLRWQHAGTSFKLVVGPYFTRYEQVGSALSTFGHLYQNRDWLSAQFAFAREF